MSALNAQSIVNKYRRINQTNTSHLLIKIKYRKLSDFFNSRKKLYGIYLPGADRRELCLKFLLCLEEWINVYRKEIRLEANNCVYVHLLLSSSTPCVVGYSFVFEELIIDICDQCYNFFLDEYRSNQYDQGDLRLFINEWMEDHKVVQIKNINRREKIKVLCCGNYYVLDQRILMNEKEDMRTEYEKIVTIEDFCVQIKMS